MPRALQTVVHDYVEGARDGNNELVTTVERVPSAAFAARNVVEIENALDGERDVAFGLDKAEVAPGVVDLGKIYQARVSVASHGTPGFPRGNSRIFP